MAIFTLGVFHGGAGKKTTIIIQREVSNATCGQPPSAVPWVFVAVVIGWEAPGCRLNNSIPFPQNQNFVPNDVLSQRVTVKWGTGGNEIRVYCPRKIVEWCSADLIQPVLERSMPATSQHLARTTRSPGPALPSNGGSATMTPRTGGITSHHSMDRSYTSDLSALASKLGDVCGSGSGKADTNEREQILSWFGIERTGRMITLGPGGEVVPEYVLLTIWAKNERAIVNPYGYRNGVATGLQIRSRGLRRSGCMSRAGV